MDALAAECCNSGVQASGRTYEALRPCIVISSVLSRIGCNFNCRILCERGEAIAKSLFPKRAPAPCLRHL